MVDWLHCFWPKARQDTDGMVEESCSAHGSQEAESKELGIGYSPRHAPSDLPSTMSHLPTVTTQ